MTSSAARKTALITGVTGGFGREIARALIQRGFDVLGTTRDIHSASATSLQEELGSALRLERLDVCSASDFEALRGIRFDVAICNAGKGAAGPIEAFSEESVRELFDTNFMGVHRTLCAVLPEMRRQRSGRIIGISSVLGLCAIPFAGAYCASKFALSGLLGSLRNEVSVYGIAVHLVEPAAYGTGFADNLSFADDKGIEAEYYAQSDLPKKIGQGWESAHRADLGPVVEAVVNLAEGTDPRFHVTVDEVLVGPELSAANSASEAARASWYRQWLMDEFI